MDKNLNEFLYSVNISDVAKAKIRSLFHLKDKLDKAKFNLNFSLAIFLSFFVIVTGFLAIDYRGDMVALYTALMEQWLLLCMIAVLTTTYYLSYPNRYKKKKDEADEKYQELRKEIAEEINDHYNVWLSNKENIAELYRLITYLDEQHGINIKYKSKT